MATQPQQQQLLNLTIATWLCPKCQQAEVPIVDASGICPECHNVIFPRLGGSSLDMFALKVDMTTYRKLANRFQ